MLEIQTNLLPRHQDKRKFDDAGEGIPKSFWRRVGASLGVSWGASAGRRMSLSYLGVWGLLRGRVLGGGDPRTHIILFCSDGLSHILAGTHRPRPTRWRITGSGCCSLATGCCILASISPNALAGVLRMSLPFTALGIFPGFWRITGL